MQFKRYTLYIISDNKYYARQCRKSMDVKSGILIDATKFKSFSQAVNKCITRSPTEVVIICQDRIRPSKKKINKMLDLINDGYGIVAMHRLRFFAVKKDLVRKIGFFDERYIGNDYEDFDMMHRLKEEDVAYYESEEVNFVRDPMKVWGFKQAKKHYKEKWKNGNTMFVRLLKEDMYIYELGKSRTNSEFLPWSKSILLQMSQRFMDKPIRRKKAKKKKSFWNPQ